RVSSGNAASSSGSCSAVTAVNSTVASLSCHFGLNNIRAIFMSKQSIQNADSGQVLADDHAEIREHENQQGSRNTIAPPALPLEHVVAQGFEVGDAWAMQPH